MSGTEANKNQHQNTSPVRLAGLGAAGVWLMMLIVVSVAIAVVIFSATQFQTRLANLAISGKALSVWKANQLREEWAANVLSLNNAAKDLGSARKALDDNRQYMEQAVAARSENEGQVYAQLADLVGRASPVKPELAGKLKDAEWYYVPVLVAESIDLSKFSEIRSSLDIFIAAHQKWIDADRKVIIGDKQKSQLEEILNKRSKDFEDAKRAVSLNLPGEDASIENAVYEFQAMYDSYPLSYRVTLAPSDLLVLILVIAMGVLGASLQLSYVYTTEFARKPISYYVFRPFLGIITALGIFIIAKAGIPLIADTNRIASSVPINPYFIAFLGILSGFMGDRALQSLQQLGLTYFRDAGSGEPARWARMGLRQRFDEVHRDPKFLKSTFGVDDADIDAWLEGKKPVPKEAQILISAVLDVSRRDLFTDLPPEEKDMQPPSHAKPEEMDTQPPREA